MNMIIILLLIILVITTIVIVTVTVGLLLARLVRLERRHLVHQLLVLLREGLRRVAYVYYVYTYMLLFCGCGSHSLPLFALMGGPNPHQSL